MKKEILSPITEIREQPEFIVITSEVKWYRLRLSGIDEYGYY